MIQANIHQAKTQLSKLIERAEAGEEVVIARNGKPSVRLMPVGEAVAPRRPAFGALRGKIVFAPDYAQADAQIAAMFEEGVSGDDVAAPGLDER